MTISTTTSRQPYNGNGVTTEFAIPFRFFANTDLVVQLVTISTGASTTLTLTTHYTVTGADEEDGGSLTMVTAPAVGQRLVIRRVIAATQEVDYVAGDPFPAETHERALDRLTMLAQQGEEVNARALVFPAGDTVSGELPAVATRASRLLGFDSSGNLVTSAPASGSAAELAIDLAGTGGAALVGFQQAGAGAVAQTLATRNANLILATDYATIQQALDAAGETKTVIIPESYSGTDSYDDCIYNAVIDLRKIPNGPPTNRVSGIGIGSVLTTNGDATFPMGHDLVMRGKGSSDMYLEHLNIRCTTTQTLVPGVNDITISAVTVGNATRGNVYEGDAYLFAEAGSMMIDRETDDEEQVNPPNIEILNATTIRLTLANGHTGTTDIEMIGSTLLSSWDLFIGSGLTKPVGNTTWDAPLRLKDLGGRIIAKIPGNIDNGPPHGMWQWGCIQSGLFGANRDLYYKHNLSASRVIWRSSADVDIATLDNNGRLTVSAGVGGGSAALRTDGDVGELQVGGRITGTPSSTTDAFVTWMGATALNPGSTSGSLGLFARNIANTEVVIGSQNTANVRVRGTQAGFFGVTPVSRQTLPAAATDAATTQALANSLRSALIALGLCQ